MTPGDRLGMVRRYLTVPANATLSESMVLVSFFGGAGKTDQHNSPF
jgi:hypothetical protein